MYKDFSLLEFVALLLLKNTTLARYWEHSTADSLQLNFTGIAPQVPN